MASAPDSPAILTKGDVGAITIELESGELAMESDADTICVKRIQNINGFPYVD